MGIVDMSMLDGWDGKKESEKQRIRDYLMEELGEQLVDAYAHLREENVKMLIGAKNAIKILASSAGVS